MGPEWERTSILALTVRARRSAVLARIADAPRQTQPRDATRLRPLTTMSMSMSSRPVLHAYRHVLRHGLRAIKFSKPARYTLRDRLRLAFRKSPASDFDPVKIETTLEFLRYAEEFNGLEHDIVKGVLRVWWDQDLGGRSKYKTKVP
jgi:hypothetical protein